MKYKQLGKTNITVPQLSFGASVFNNFFQDCKFDLGPESVARVRGVIKTALKEGINYFDVAPWYGIANFLLSQSLKDEPRESYYLATKVGRYNSDKKPSEWFDFSAERTLRSVNESLELFKTDYIDLIQVHDFEFAENLDEILNETLPVLHELRKCGKVRYIGINSYSLEKIKELLDKSTVPIDTVLTFTHLTLDDTSLLNYVDYFRGKKVGIINSAPLCMGLYTETGVPHWHNAPSHVKMAAEQAFVYCRERGVSLTKLALFFSASCTLVDTTIVSMPSEKIVGENAQLMEVGLSDQERRVLEEIRNLYFIPLGYQGYGDKEVIGYRNKINLIKQDQLDLNF